MIQQEGIIAAGSSVMRHHPFRLSGHSHRPASVSVPARLPAAWVGLFAWEVKLALVTLLGVLAAGAVVAAEGMIRLPHGASAAGLCYSPDGKTLATGAVAGNLILWEAATGKELWRATGAEAQGVAFSPDGRTLAAGGWKGIIRIWDAADHSKLREFATGEDIYTLAFSPDGKSLAGGGREGGVRLWDAGSGKAVRFFKGGGRVQSVAFSPDGSLLAYGTTGDRMYVFDSTSGEEVPRFRGKERQGGHVAFSPDGRIFAAGGSEKGGAFVDLREVATGGVIRRLRLDGDRVYSLAFSPDGRAVAVGGSKPTVKVWGLATGQMLGTFEGHSSEVFAVRFSPDGTSLAAVSRDKTAILWEVARRMKKEKESASALATEALDRLWKDLADEDVSKAYRAVWTLRAVPTQALPLLSERLRAATTFDERRVGQLIGDLDSDRGVTRQRAESELAKMGWVVESAFRRSLKGKPSPEVRRRLTRLLQGVESAGTDPNWLRVHRAFAVLEGVGTPSAVRTLKTHAGGQPEARTTREAAGALRRLAKRPPR
jgi:WD40 repeat protein